MFFRLSQGILDSCVNLQRHIDFQPFQNNRSNRHLIFSELSFLFNHGGNSHQIMQTHFLFCSFSSYLGRKHLIGVIIHQITKLFRRIVFWDIIGIRKQKPLSFYLCGFRTIHIGERTIGGSFRCKVIRPFYICLF